MNSLLKTALILLAVLGIVCFGIWYQLNQQKPDVLIAKLKGADSQEERQAFLIQLQLARGDVTGLLIVEVENLKNSKDFRLSLLDLLFRRMQREGEHRIMPTLMKCLEDENAEIRQFVVKGITTFVQGKPLLKLLPLLNDKNEGIRKEVYQTFLGVDWRVWENTFSQTDRGELVKRARAQMSKEKDPDLIYLTRALVGRQLTKHLDDADRAANGGDLSRAVELMKKAENLDGTHPRLAIANVRHQLMLDDKIRARREAEKYKALLKVPKLQQAPVIDGDPTDSVWGEQALKVELKALCIPKYALKLSKSKSDAYIAHHEGYIYIAVIGYEQELDKLVAKHKSRDSNVYQDDCVELFFDPEGKGKNSYQFIINSRNALFDSFKKSRKVNVECEHRTKIFKDRGYWACEFKVKAGLLEKGELSKSSLWGINLCRVRIGPASEYVQFWPTFGQAHNYMNFPFAVFEGI